MIDMRSYIEKCRDDVNILNDILSTGKVQLDGCQEFAYWYKRYLFEQQRLLDRRYPSLVLAKYVADVVAILQEDVESIDMFGLESCFVKEAFKKIEKLLKTGKDAGTKFVGALACKNRERVLVRIKVEGEAEDLIIDSTDDLVKWALAFALYRVKGYIDGEGEVFAEYVKTYVSNIYRHLSGRDLLESGEPDTLVERLAS